MEDHTNRKVTHNKDSKENGTNDKDNDDKDENNGTNTKTSLQHKNSTNLKAFFFQNYNILIAFGLPIVIPTSILCGIVFAYPETFGDISVFHVIGLILLIIGYSVLVSGCVVCVYDRCNYNSVKKDRRAITKDAFTESRKQKKKKTKYPNQITPRRYSKRMSTSVVRLKPISENTSGTFAPDGDDVEVIKDLQCTIHVPTIVEQEIT